MAAFRWMAPMSKRDGAAQNGEGYVGSYSTMKLCNSKALIVASGLLISTLNSLTSRIQAVFASMFSQRSSRFRERLRARGLHGQRTYFQIFFFFMVGVLIGLTPFLLVDVSKNFTAEDPTIPFEKDPAVEVISVDEPVINSPSTLENWMVKNESVETELAPQKLLIIVSPTYVRPFQAYYLNRLIQTLRNVPPPLLWIVVDMYMQSVETAKILRGSGLMYRHLVCVKNVTNRSDRGLYQRNVGLSHIEKHRLNGIVHFADDKDIYSIDLFDQMRQIRRFGAWPVAMFVGSSEQVLLEGPICNGSHVIRWHTNENEISRRFRAEVAGFAFNSTILWDPTRWYRETAESVQEGLEEITYIEQLLKDESETECLAKNCSLVMVWSIDLEVPELVYPKGWVMKNLEIVLPLS